LELGELLIPKAFYSRLFVVVVVVILIAETQFMYAQITSQQGEEKNSVQCKSSCEKVDSLKMQIIHDNE